MTVSIKNTVEPAIRNLVMSASGLERVIYSHPNAPRPEMPYATINKISTSKVIDDWQKFDQNTSILHLYGVRTMRYSVTVYGDDAVDIANAMQSRLFLQNNRETLYNEANTSILDCMAVTNDYQLVNSHYEERAIVDIIFNVVFENGEVTEDVGYFDEISMNWVNKP